jgi:hypothetical protein
MSNYKFVQWNDSTPLDHQRLYTMSENDQYLYDLVSKSADGLLYTNTLTSNKSIATSTTVFPTAGSFYVRENRVIKATFAICGVYTAATDANWNRFRFDFVFSPSFSGTQILDMHLRNAGAGTGFPCLVTEMYGLEKGYHTVNIQCTVTSVGTNTAYIEAGSSIFIEDLGENTELPTNKIY